MVDPRIQQLAELNFRHLKELCDIESSKFSPSQLTQERAISNVHRQLTVLQAERDYISALAREELRLHSKFVLNQTQISRRLAVIERALTQQLHALANTQGKSESDISNILSGTPQNNQKDHVSEIHHYLDDIIAYLQEDKKAHGAIFAYSLAVSEENASGNVVVTAPTCGASGVVPATLRYLKEVYDLEEIECLRALSIAGLLGNIVKRNGSISGAEVGCQGEVGVACSMAAGMAAYIFGGNLQQIDYAAEMGLEHHL